MLNAARSALLQVFVCFLIPWLIYVLSHQRVTGFFKYIGLYRPEGKTLGWAVLLALIATPLLLSAFWMGGLREVATSPHSVAGKIRQVDSMGQAVAILLLYAWMQTSLSEEILFRGFLAKRLMDWLGFTVGNLLQALIFGAIHLGLFFALLESMTWTMGLLLLAPPTLIGWLLGYLKEKLGNGSIVPGWISHALANTIAYAVVAFAW